jgi:hypothetical protein
LGLIGIGHRRRKTGVGLAEQKGLEHGVVSSGLLFQVPENDGKPVKLNS